MQKIGLRINQVSLSIAPETSDGLEALWRNLLLPLVLEEGLRSQLAFGITEKVTHVGGSPQRILNSDFSVCDFPNIKSKIA